jgi:5-methylcytosine-specific restriction endonuclease McrA
VVSCVKKLIECYYSKARNNQPIRYERLTGRVDALSMKAEHDKAIEDIVAAIKTDVSWRFLSVQGTDVKIYDYKKGASELRIEASLLRILHENEQDLYDLINYRWGMILETFNNSPRISKKVRIMDDQEISRSSLAKYRQYLDLENSDHICFICGEPIPEKEISIDHVIPWGYMYSDDIWNLVYVHRSCNSQKGIIIPEKSEIERLKERNDRLLAYMQKLNHRDKRYEELSMAKEHNYVEKFWVGCKS